MNILSNAAKAFKYYIEQMNDYAKAVEIKNQCRLLMEVFDNSFCSKLSEELKQEVLNSNYILINEKLYELNYIVSKYNSQIKDNKAESQSKVSSLEEKILSARNELLDQVFKLFLAR
jgi:hypothetical protein